jgi:hypothetical protein
MNRLNRQIFVLGKQQHRLPWGDSERKRIENILRGKRAALRYRIADSEARWPPCYAVH